MTPRETLSTYEIAQGLRALARALVSGDVWEPEGQAATVYENAKALVEAEAAAGPRTEAVIDWLLHPDRSYAPHELATETVRRLREAEAAAGPRSGIGRVLVDPAYAEGYRDRKAAR